MFLSLNETSYGVSSFGIRAINTVLLVLPICMYVCNFGYLEDNKYFNICLFFISVSDEDVGKRNQEQLQEYVTQREKSKYDQIRLDSVVIRIQQKR